MKKSKREIICSIREPDEEGSLDISNWQQEQKAELEAEGITITKIDGFTFYGYRTPIPPDGQS